MAATRDRIVRISFDLFRLKGYDQVTINEICQAAQISKHTFYYYFDSKEALLKDFIQIPSELKQEIMAEIIKLDSPLQQYIAAITPQIQYLENCGAEIIKKLLVNNLTTDFHLPEETAEPQKIHPILDLEVSLIAKAQKKGEIKNLAEPARLVQTALIIMVGMAQIWATSDGRFALTDNYLKTIRVLLQAEETK